MRRAVACLVPSILLGSWVLGCGSTPLETRTDGGPSRDAARPSDAGEAPDVASHPDAGRPDGPSDAGHDSGHDGGRDADVPDGPFVMAAHPPLPTLINYGTATRGVLTAPQVVTVTFAGDPNASAYEALGEGIASSTWWDEVIHGFCDSDGGPCIGHGPPGVSARLPTAAMKSYTNAEIESLLAQQITDKVLPMPEPSSLSESIYVVYFPETTVVHRGGRSCGNYGFFGYHGTFTLGSQRVPYAVIDECSAGSPEATLASTTETTSHEILEAATDSRAGFYLDLSDPSTYGWNDLLGGEVGDLCDWFGPPNTYAYWPLENVPYVVPDGGPTLMVQRIWSNPQVARGGDPCLPIPPGVVFFGAAPDSNVFVLDVGGSVTFDATVFSTAPTPDFTILALDFTPSKKSFLSLSIEGAKINTPTTITGKNGDVLKITVTLEADPGKTSYGEADGTLLSYSGPPDAPTAAYEWPFIVLTPADAEHDGIDAAVSMRPERRQVRPRHGDRSHGQDVEQQDQKIRSLRMGPF